MSDNKTAQERFDEMFITGSEIQSRLSVNRSTILNARRRGLLPDPIVVRGTRAFIWEREKVTPYLDAWQIALSSRRKELV